MLIPGYFEYVRRLGYERNWAVAILLLQLFAVLFEGISIGMVLPIIEYLKSGESAANLATESMLWQWILKVADFAGVPVNLVTLMGTAFLTILIRQLFIYIRDVVTGWVQFELVRRLRNQGFHHFIYAGLESHDSVNAGTFVAEMTTEVASGVGVMTTAVNFMATILLICGYITIVSLLSPSLTLAAIAVLLLVALILGRLTTFIRRLGEQVTESNQQLSRFLVEKLSAIRLIRLSGVERAEDALLMNRTHEQQKRFFARAKLIALLGVLVEPIIVAVAFVLLYIAVYALELDFGTIVLFFFILLRLAPIVKTAIMQRQAYLASLASVEVVDQRLRQLKASRDAEGGDKTFLELKDAIVFEDVTFEYATGAEGSAQPPALDHVTLTIPAGQMTALVGPSGSGKSTLIDLLPRLRTPQSGRILFDGIPQEEFRTVSLRQSIAFAPQLPQIFNVSPAEHIRYGKPDATMKEIVAAAKLAQANEFIEALPNGYDTPLGEDGRRLSGGQRQRLDLARALVRGAPILVLDEPTANLDANAEAVFRETLDRIRKKTTTTIVIIGHRLSTIQMADQIVVLKNGRIGQKGRHASLMQKGGWYKRAFARQNEVGETTVEKIGTN